MVEGCNKAELTTLLGIRKGVMRAPAITRPCKWGQRGADRAEDSLAASAHSTKHPWKGHVHCVDVLLGASLEVEQRLGLRFLVASLGLVELVSGLGEEVEGGGPVVGHGRRRGKGPQLAHPVADEATDADGLGPSLPIRIFQLDEPGTDVSTDPVRLSDELPLGQRSVLVGSPPLTACRRQRKRTGGTQPHRRLRARVGTDWSS